MGDFLLMVLACGAATYVWRGLGVVLSAGLDTKSPLFDWAACVALAMIAGLIARILVFPTGLLAETVLWQRIAATVIALAAFYLLTRRNLLVGVLAGSLAMVALAGLS